MVALFSLLLVNPVAAQDDVYFSTAAAGEAKAITDWGVEVAWINGWNLMQSKAHMGESEIDVVFANFWPKYALDAGGNLPPLAIVAINQQINAASSLPNAAWALGVDITGTDAYYFSPSGFNAQRWHDLMEATKDYIESASGKTVAYAMPYNEADYWGGTQGTPSDLNDVATLLAANANFNGVGIMGPSTLNSAYAQNDYSAAKGPLTHGSTHQLQDTPSANSAASFYQYVASQGDIPYAPELHSLGEAIFSAQYGVEGGAWWGAVLRPRGLFVRACQGDRLGYDENRPNSGAAAVYRAPDGELYGFAGCFERQGLQTPYRFVCTDRDVYFNGIGPMREYVLPVNINEDSYVNIDYDTDIIPALDGHRWQIVNRQTGQALEAKNGWLGNGVNIQVGDNLGDPQQKWDIIRSKDGYYQLLNVNSTKAVDVYNSALDSGANIVQWDNLNGFNQYWYIDDAGNGYYYVRNANSTLYMAQDTAGIDVKQRTFTGSYYQQWQFVLVDPIGSGTPTAYYEFEGNANDSAGSNHGTTSGSPVYTTGPVGQAIDLDGVNDFVTLPSGIANVDDITIATWVNWDGGNAWQKIFDFGNNTTQYLYLSPSDSNGQMHFVITSDGPQGKNDLITDALPVGQWVHVAVTLRGNTGILYIDGLPRVAGHIGINPSDFNPTKNYIGDSQWASHPFFNGQIDDFRIYNYALTADDIAGLANVPPDTTPPAAPTGLSATGGDGSVGLDWADNTEDDLDSYTVYRSTTSGSNYVAVASGLTSSTNTDNSVTNGTMYYYVVTASDTSTNESAFSSPPVSVVPSAPIAPEEYYIAEIVVVAGTNVTLTVSNSVLGHTYGMLAADVLASPTVWSNIMDKAGSGSDLLFGIPIGPAPTNRFFKLDVQRQ